MIKGIKNYKFPDDVIILGKAVNFPLHKVYRIVPGTVMAVGGLLILWLQLSFYFDDVYLYENNLRDTYPEFGFNYIFPSAMLFISAIIAFVSMAIVNKYRTVGRAGDNAISYVERNNMLLIRKWEYTYEINIKDIIDIKCKNDIGTVESYAFKRYIPDEKRHVYDIHTYKYSTRKITFIIKSNNTISKISVPVWDGANVYIGLKQFIESYNKK